MQFHTVASDGCRTTTAATPSTPPMAPKSREHKTQASSRWNPCSCSCSSPQLRPAWT